MAKWYNAYLADDEKRKQVGQKGITARRRKQQASAISQDISNSGIVRGSKGNQTENAGSNSDTRKLLEQALRKKTGKGR